MKDWHFTRQDGRGYKYQEAFEENYTIIEHEDTGLVEAFDYSGELMWSIQMVRDKWWEMPHSCYTCQDWHGNCCYVEKYGSREFPVRESTYVCSRWS